MDTNSEKKRDVFKIIIVLAIGLVLIGLVFNLLFNGPRLMLGVKYDAGNYNIPYFVFNSNGKCHIESLSAYDCSYEKSVQSLFVKVMFGDKSKSYRFKIIDKDTIRLLDETINAEGNLLSYGKNIDLNTDGEKFKLVTEEAVDESFYDAYDYGTIFVTSRRITTTTLSRTTTRYTYTYPNFSTTTTRRTTTQRTTTISKMNIGAASSEVVLSDYDPDIHYAPKFFVLDSNLYAVYDVEANINTPFVSAVDVMKTGDISTVLYVSDGSGENSYLFATTYNGTVYYINNLIRSKKREFQYFRLGGVNNVVRGYIDSDNKLHLFDPYGFGYHGVSIER